MTASPPISRTPRAWPAIAVFVVALSAALAWSLGGPAEARPDGAGGEVTLYWRVATDVLNGRVPWRDFPMEYPPAAIVAWLLPRSSPTTNDASPAGYALAFGATQIAWLAAAVWAASRLVPDRAARAAAFATLAAIPLAPVLLFRYDAFPAAMATFALLAAARGRPTTSGALIAVGALAKVWPIVLGPVLLIGFLARGDRRAAIRFVAGGIVAASAIVVPITLLAPDWASQFAGYHLRRGVQIESLPASVALFVGRATVTFEYGAHHVAAPGLAPIGRFALPALMLAALAIVYALAWRRWRHEPRDAATLPLAAFAATLAFVAFNKVLSPQFLVWLVPLAGLIGRGASRAFVAACALTFLVFPVLYDDLVRQQADVAIGALVARNALLLVTFALGLRALSRRLPI